MKEHNFSVFKVVIVLLVGVILMAILMKGWNYTQRYYLSKKEADKIFRNVSGYYSITALAPEYLDYLMSSQGRIECQSMFNDAEYEALIHDPESYEAYSIDIFLDNHSEIDLGQLQIISNNKDVYIYGYSYLTCDKPLLIANTCGESETQEWIVIRKGSNSESTISNMLKNLELYGKGKTPHGYEYIWNIPCKLE